MRISQATALLGPLQTTASACAHSHAATTGPAAGATASLGATSPQRAGALASMSLDHRIAVKVADADELRRSADEKRQRLRELQEELDAAQDAAGSFWSQVGAWFFGHDGGVAELSGSAAAHDGLSQRLQRHLTERQQATQLAGAVSGRSDETLDDLLRRLG